MDPTDIRARGTHAGGSSLRQTTPRVDRTFARLRRALASVGVLFPRNDVVDDVVTYASIAGPPEDVWRRIMFYEEVPQRPPLVLRLLLSAPLRSTKSRLAAGANVECVYSGGGRFLKRVTAVEPPSLVRFEVLEQRLGIEPCLTTVSGSYGIRAAGACSEVALTTTYRGHLRPRWLWRKLERWIAHLLHRHILRGMGASFEAGHRS